MTASDGSVTECNTSVQSGDVEKEIDIEKDKEVEKEKKKKVAASAYVDDPELNTAICDFVENRKKLRKPMTDKAIVRLFVRHLQGMTDSVQDQIDLINTAIECGWLTVYPSKGEQRQASSRQQVMSADDCLQGIINGDLNLKETIFFDERRSCKNALRDPVRISADIFKMFCTGYYKHGFCMAFSA
ncbi:MAG: hypothetical protein V8S58_13615 [Lachnospiraceae bacterium]